MDKNNCVERFFERSKNNQDSPAYYAKKGDAYEMYTWAEYGVFTQNFAKGLLSLGHEPGQALAILAFNRPEWLISCIGTQAVAGVSAGIYTSCASEDVKHVLNHSEAPFVVVENKKSFDQQISPISKELPGLRYIIMLEDADKVEDERVISFASVVESGSKLSNKELDKRRGLLKADTIATYIYTSGTTGKAKAVMLSHGAIEFTVAKAVSSLEVTAKDSILSYLPLAHVAEQMFSVYAPIYSGVAVYFAESLEKLPINLKESQPTVFFGVPRVYEKFHEKLTQRLETLTGLKKFMFEFFGDAAAEYWTLKHSAKAIPLLLRLQYALGCKLVFNKVKDAVGLSRARLCISGAAPISSTVIGFFMRLDLPVYEVYGQSEDSGPTSFNFPGQTRLGSVGKPFPGVAVRIASDGEILVKGPNLFSGYYKDETATKEALQEGWLFSGDIGEFDSEGFLKITDRKKDLLITAGGKNVAPQNLESLLKQIPMVSSAVVVGDRRKYLAALLTPNFENIQTFAKNEGILNEDNRSLLRNGKILEAIQKQIDTMNKKLTSVEQIKKFLLLPQDFSIENGELTPTMKVKRKIVSAHYEDEINQLYS